MTKQEYNNLPRFKKEEHIYPHNNVFYENEIFEVHTLHNTIKYVKIIKNFYNSIFVLQECNMNGELIDTLGYGSFEAKPEEIKWLIDNEKLWRIFKPARSRVIRASN